MSSTVIQVRGHGPRLCPTLQTHICLPLSSQLGSGAVSAWPSGTRTPSAHDAVTPKGRWENHALSCVCGGDRVCRHNAVRDEVRSVARDCCSLAPVKEKAWSSASPSFLLSRPGQPRPPAQPTSGFFAAPLGRQGPGTSPSAVPLCPSTWSRADWDSGTVFQCVEPHKVFFHDGFLSGTIRLNWNDTEKIRMAPAQG